MAERRHTVLIVGASAAGLRCACRLARLRPDWHVRVLEAGETFSYAACGLPYALSGDIDDPRALRSTTYGLVRDAEFFAAYKRVEVLPGHRAVAIETERQVLRADGPDGPLELQWDELVLATGARPRRLPDQPDHPRVASFHVWDDLRPLRQRLATGGVDRDALILWDVDTHQELLTLAAEGSVWLREITASPDGTIIAAISSDDGNPVLHRWYAPSFEQIAQRMNKP